MAQGRETSSGGPPLRMVAIAGTIGMVGFLILSLMLTSTAFVNAAKDRYFLATMDTQFSDTDALQIVLFGDSRMWFALADDAAIAEEMSNVLGTPVGFASNYATNGEFRGFRAVIPEILAQSPDIIMVQSALPFKQKNRQGLSNLNRDMMLQATFLRAEASQARLAGLDDCGNLSMEADLQAAGGLDDLDTDFANNGAAYAGAEAILDQIQASDTQLVFVTAPDPRFGTLPLPGHPRITAPEIQPAAAIPAEHFCDPLHVMPEGTALYTAAFVQDVTDWLKTQ